MGRIAKKALGPKDFSHFTLTGHKPVSQRERKLGPEGALRPVHRWEKTGAPAGVYIRVQHI